MQLQPLAYNLMTRTNYEPSNNITAFIVPTDLPGITLGKLDEKMGQRGTQTCDVILEDVRVPAKNIIGEVPGQGFKTAMKVLDRGRKIGRASCRERVEGGGGAGALNEEGGR